MVIDIINKGIGYIQTGVGFVRGTLMTLLKYLPWDNEISLFVLFFGISLYLAYLYVKKFTLSPFSAKNLFYLILLAALIFLLLMFL